LASILLRSGFTDDGARRAARVYKENAAFVATLQSGIDEEPSSDVVDGDVPVAATTASVQRGITTVAPPHVGNAILAQYQIPLGSNHAQLTFTGNKLTADDFDALSEYVTMFKKQFLRRGVPPEEKSE